MANPEQETWLQQLNQEWFNDRWAIEGSFLATIDQLRIRSEWIKGNVGVIGQASLFPERTLVCKPPEFEQLRPEISTLICIDYELGTNPSHRLPDEDVQLFYNPEDLDSSKRVFYSPLPAQMALPRITTGFFDALIAFQIVDLGKQLQEGLVEEIVKVLKPGGYFFGSGGLQISRQDFLRTISPLSTPLDTLQLVDLPNPSYAGYPFDEHMGFIMIRR